jgi:hypothetical protein
MAQSQTVGGPAGQAAQRVVWSAGRPHWIADRLRAVIFAAAGLSLVLTGCTDSITGRGAASPDLGRWQAPPVQPQQLGDLLLNAGEVNTVGRSTTMALRMPTSTMQHSENVVSDPQCLGAHSPIQAEAYHGSNWVAVRGQLIDDDTPAQANRNGHALLQAVVGFRDADSAQQFFTQAKPAWSVCVNRPMIVNRPQRLPITYDFGALSTTETTLSMVQTMRGGGLACQRAMGLVNNVIVDTLWCGLDTIDQASQVITKIAAAATQA